MLYSDLVILIIIIFSGILYLLLKSIKSKKKQQLLDNMKKSHLKYYEKLQEEGYKIIDYNSNNSFTAEINGKEYSLNYQVPMILKKGKKKFILYIKKEKDNLRLSTKAAREYFMFLCKVFNVHGAVIINSETLKTNSVVFYKDN